ncbi:MAG: DinB family protein [Gemmatimonadales bacterium]|nr:DinB family protein [Gemmatimonadales bacterium]
MLGALLAEQVRLAHDGPAWHGPALAENLERVTAVEAAARPIPEGHSIWEIVLHATAWAGEVRRRLRGGMPAAPAEGDWPEVGPVSEAAWQEARRGLRVAHEALAEAVLGFPEARWSERIGDERDAPLGTGVTFAAMIAGLVQHDGYHGGQIGLLRRALNPGAASPP